LLKILSFEEEKRYEVYHQVHLCNSLAADDKLLQRFLITRYSLMKRSAVLIFQAIVDGCLNQLWSDGLH
jgi:hypothetical protein